MRSIRRLVVVILAAGLPVAIAGPTWAKGSPKPKKPNIVVFTNAQLQPALLALADMPTGYAAVPLPPNQPSGTDGTCNGPNEAARGQTAGAAASGVVEFAQNPTTGPFISESIYSFPTVQAAQAFMTATRTQAASCTTYSSASSGSPTNYAVTQLSFAKVADDTLAIRRTASQPGTTGSSGSVDNIVIRVGNNAINISEGALTGPDTTLEQQYVGKAVSKLGIAIVAAKPPKKKK